MESNILYKIAELSELEKNWDSYDGIPISKQIIDNTMEFLEKLPNYFTKELKADNITATPHGTIVLDFWNDSAELISIEVGSTKIGYFTELVDPLRSFVGEDFEVNQIPLELIQLFRDIYPLACN